jgi:uncharacterized protein
MSEITRTLVSRHGLGRNDAYDAALLDIAQDHVLFLLDQAGAIDRERLVFKGGTSLRKCRLGNDCRFSTDLDFAAPDDDVVLDVCEVLHGGRVAGFTFSLEPTRRDGRHWMLTATHEILETPNIAASVEFGRRPLALPPERLGLVPLPIHKTYSFELPTLPVVAEAEACCGEARPVPARFIGSRPLRLEPLRRSHHRRSSDRAPVDPQGLGRCRRRSPQRQTRDTRRRAATAQRARLPSDSIGVLARPVDMVGWERRVRRRFAFLRELDADEQRWAACDERHRREIDDALAQFRTQ